MNVKTIPFFKLALCSFVALAFANFLASFFKSLVYGYPHDANPHTVENVLLLFTILSSGLVINLGTIIQVFSQCRSGGNASVNIRYTQCLVAGCLVLLVGQVHSSMNYVLDTPSLKDINWAAFLATPLTTLLSFVCSAAFYFVNTRVTRGAAICTEEVDSFSNTSKNLLCPENSKPNNNLKRLVFLEGTACLGKTTCSDQTFDYAHYLQLYPDYNKKNSEMYVQSMYEANLYADVLYALIGENATSLLQETYYQLDSETRASFLNTSARFSRAKNIVPRVTYFDRSPFSQIAYSILYHLNGHVVEPHIFAEQLDNLFADERFTDELRSVFQKWIALFHQLYPNVEVKLIWFGAQSPSGTVQRMLKRGGIETKFDWNLLHFVHNQNKLFRTIQERTGFGEYRETLLINRSDLTNELTSDAAPSSSQSVKLVTSV